MYLEINKQPFLFIHIGDTAGTSIEYYFYSVYYKKNYITLNGYDYKKGDFSYTKTIRTRGFKQFQKKTNFGSHCHHTRAFYERKVLSKAVIFSVVRDPYKKLLAKFFKSFHAEGIKELEDGRYKFVNFLKEVYEKKTIWSKSQFMHNRCQSNYIFHNGKYLENVLRFENLSQDFKNFQKKFSLPVKDLLKINSLHHPLKTMDLYNEESKEIVYIKNKQIIDDFYKRLN